MSGAPGPIPWTAVEAYARAYRFTGSAFDDLLTIVRIMDRAFVRWAMERMDRDGNS